MKQSHLTSTQCKDIAADELSINSQLLIKAGYINRLMAGVYTFLPLGLKVLNKIEDIIRQEMVGLGAQEILMPALQPADLWKKTNRWDKVDVLFKLKGAGDRDLALGPTHEEVVTALAAQYLRSHKQLPASFFQIQTKFRDEARAKAGLLRGREFRMKDLYSFHTSEADLDLFYAKVMESYQRIFQAVGLGSSTYQTLASGGMFTQFSHEYQTVTPSGEDTIYLCETCKTAVNKELFTTGTICASCQGTAFTEHKAIEVGNIFKLMTRFSDALNANAATADNKLNALVMGCYGIGPSRLLGTVVEVHHDDKGIIWPKSIAPFQLHLVSLCKDAAERQIAETVYNQLTKQGIDVLFDDRMDGSPGFKLTESELLGMPLRLVIGTRGIKNGQLELTTRATGIREEVSLAGLLDGTVPLSA